MNEAVRSNAADSSQLGAVVYPRRFAATRNLANTPFAWAGAHRWRLAQLLAIAIVLGLWQLSEFFLRPLFISTPSNVAVGLYQIVANGQLFSALSLSLVELVIGLALSWFIGVTLGILMGSARLLERALEPLVVLGNATPVIVLMPLMEVWFGFGSMARVAFIITISIFTMIVNTLAGARAMKKSTRDIAQAFGIKGARKVWQIVLPSTMPYIFAGARISLAQAIVGMILAGQEVGQAGIGGIAQDFGTFFETAKLIAAISVTTVLALVLFGALRMLQDLAFPWIRETSLGRERGQ